MPHTRSASSKKEANLKKSEKKWLNMFFAAVPALCQRFYNQYNSETDALIWIRGKKRGSTLIASHETFHIYDTMDNEKHLVTLEFNFRNTRHTTGYTLPVLVLPVREYLKKVYIEPHDIRIVYRNDYPDFRNPFDETAQAKIHTIVYEWLRDMLVLRACKKRSQRIKEELVAAVWRPDRLVRRLEEGGWEAVEAFA